MMRTSVSNPVFVLTALLCALLTFPAASADSPDVRLDRSPGRICLVFGTQAWQRAEPLGAWYATDEVTVNRNGAEACVKRRTLLRDATTFRGRLNILIEKERRAHPTDELVLVTPSETGAAQTNALGLVVGDYVAVLREAGNVWAVGVADRTEADFLKRLDATGEPFTALRGKKVAFLGDSITDVRHIGCTSNYWNFLARDLGLVPLVYGINGHQWNSVLGQVARLVAEHPEGVDEIMVFAGTNDYNASVPLGSWTDGASSFRGRIAAVMNELVRHFPGTRIWLLTPLHRGYATFGAKNVQPDERHANAIGLWLDDYVAVLREAAAKGSAVHLIDLHAESGLYPLFDEHVRYFHNGTTDRLHPNTAGHERMARVIGRHFQSCDETALVQARLAALPPEGGVLRLSPGVHHFYEKSARTMMLNPSNNHSGEKKVVFPLVGRRNVTVDGSGSTLVFHGRTFPFAATNGTDLAFRNFTVTTRFPSCAGFVVTAKDEKGFTVRFDEGVAPYTVADGSLTFALDGHEVSTRNGRLSLHALDRLVIIYLMTPKSPGDKNTFPAGFVGVVPEKVGERLVRFTYTGDRHAKSIPCPYRLGEKVVVNLEEQRYRDVLFVEDCEGVRVENVTIRRFGGMGIVGQRSGNISIDHLVAETGSDERVTLTADIVQFINCYGEIALRNCSGGHSLDDWINIHGNYLQVESMAGRRVRLRTRHGSHHGFFPYRIGDALEFVTAHERTVRAVARVCAVEPDAADSSACTVTIDRDLGATVTGGLLVENVTLNPNVTIAGNRFYDYPNIRLSGRGRYRIEGNRFERCNTAVTGLDLADYWYEAGRIADMLIRGNAVVDGGGYLFGVSGWRGDEPNVPKIHGRIRLEGNTFERGRGAKWSAVGVSDFSVSTEKQGK